MYVVCVYTYTCTLYIYSFPVGLQYTFQVYKQDVSLVNAVQLSFAWSFSYFFNELNLLVILGCSWKLYYM